MLEQLVETIRADYSGLAAKEDVAAISRHHRIQASPGYRAAAQYVYEQLQAAGVEAAVESYPAAYGTNFWTSSSFQEWEATAGTLHLVEPAGEARKLADYRELKLSLIQRSASFSGRAEVVVLENGTKAADYEGLDVAGKLVLTDGPVESVRRLAVEKHGAAGILFDGLSSAPPVRELMDLPDVRQYTSFWWTGAPDEKQCFGFVLSPRQGRRLRELVRRRAAAGEGSVVVQAEVESRFYDGQMEVVTGVIPGQTQEEIVLVSHLCHPQPSANDNASGAAANLEAARTLGRLIARGDLPRPKRTIRCLWLPEMTGSYAYLAGHEDDIPQMIAGLNLDMVGEDQTQTGSVLLLERPPEASASFAPELIERLRELVCNDVQSYGGGGSYSLTRTATTPFSGGSDHYIFSDPTVGVPMPMLIQWPDKFYHTSADTLEKVSPESLAQAGTIAASFAYFSAAAGEREATWLGYALLARLQGGLAELVQETLSAAWSEAAPADDQALAKLARRLAYREDRFRAALATLGRLWPGADDLAAALVADAAQMAGQALGRARRVLGDAPADSQQAKPDGEWEARAAAMRPKRLYRGPFRPIRGLDALPEADREAWEALVGARPGWTGYTAATLAEFWADGQRTALEITDLIEQETGRRDAELVVGRFELLAKLDLVDLG